MPHQFTEPTPTSLAERVQVEVFVSSWEIECCAPAPVIGETTSWVLTFVDLSDLWQGLARDRAWQVQRRDGATWLIDGPVSARWSEHNGSPPKPGIRTVRGSVMGGIHEEGPKVTGRVQRIRFATSLYHLADVHRLEPVPGTLALTDVSEAPRSLFFDFDAEVDPSTPAADQPQSIGVLLDLTVPSPSVNAQDS